MTRVDGGMMMVVVVVVCKSCIDLFVDWQPDLSRPDLSCDRCVGLVDLFFGGCCNNRRKRGNNGVAAQSKQRMWHTQNVGFLKTGDSPSFSVCVSPNNQKEGKRKKGASGKLE